MTTNGIVRVGSCALMALVVAGKPNAQSPVMQRSTAFRPIFVENHGQFGPAVRYRTALPWPSAAITDEGLVLTQVRRESDAVGGRLLGHNVRLRFEGTRSVCAPSSADGRR